MSGDSYENLVVRADLMSPVILDRWLMLDGILAAAVIEDPDHRQRSRYYRNYRRMVKRHGLEETRRIFKEKGWEIPVAGGHFLPLAVWGHGHKHGLWVYCSSWAIPGEYEHDLVHFSRRLNFEQVDQWVEPRQKRVYTGKGEFAAKWMPFQTMVTEYLTWYVRGLRDEIESVLVNVHSIAKKRRRGYGVVRQWTVEESENDYSVFGPGGKLMRPVPARLLETLGVQGEFEYALTTYRPPYWDARYVARCAIRKRDGREE